MSSSGQSHLCDPCRSLLYKIIENYFQLRSSWRKGSPPEEHKFKFEHGSFLAIVRSRASCYLCHRLCLFEKTLPQANSDAACLGSPGLIREDATSTSFDADWILQIEAKIIYTHRSPTNIFLEIEASSGSLVTGWTGFVFTHGTRGLWKVRTLDDLHSDDSPFVASNLSLATYGITPSGKALDSSPDRRPCSHDETLCACRIANIREWISSCNDSHMSCSAAHNRAADARRLPERVIHVWDSGSKAKLVSAAVSAQGAPLKYATLSHRWGTESFLTLSQKNLDDFYRDIPVSKLGKTFREALSLCSAIGVHFIWIDSLCIIQDSEGEADWLTEAAKMHHIYGDSFLNIVATDSQQCSDGLFTPMIDTSAASRRLRIQCPGGITLSDGGTGLEHLHRYCYDSAPLLQRGWVLQETTLAPRNLHWTRSQLFWQCKQTAISEHGGSMLYTKSMHWKFMAWESISQLSSLEELGSFWRKTIYDFTGCQTTRVIDRYYALSGLAAMLRGRYAELGVTTRYLAGCWEHDLISGLLWETASSPHELPKLQPSTGSDREIHIPSWSCLKLGTNSYPSVPTHADTMTAIVSNVHLSLEDRDQAFGPVRSCRIDLVARTFKLQQGPGDRGSRDKSGDLSEIVRLESNSGRVIKFAKPDAGRTLHGELAVLTRDTLDFNFYGESSAPVKCAVIAQTLSPQRDLLRKRITVAALALRPVMNPGDKNWKYERIGLVRLRMSQGNPSLDMFIDFFSDGNLSYEPLTLV